MDLGLKGKMAVITGGSEGIGRAIASSLAREGARVAICARRWELLQKVARDIEGATGSEVLPVRADVSKREELEDFINTVLAKFQRIDILVNNAGRSGSMPFDVATDEKWQEDLDLKVFAAVRTARLVIPYMKKQGGGRIVNITHVGGKQPGAKTVPTSVTRAAGIALTKALSKEYADANILVNTVCVGWIKSAQWERRWKAGTAGLSWEEFCRLQARDVPLKRMGEAEEVGDLVAFLVSERAGYITGASVNIDGGRSAVV